MHHRAGAALALGLALLTLPGTLLHDVYKPVLATEGAPSILSLDRVGQQTIDDELAPLAAPLRRLDRLVGPHDALGFIYQETFPEYLLFGQPLQRRLVGFEPDQVSAQALRSDRLRGLFIAFANQPPCSRGQCIPHAAGLRVVALGGSSYFLTAARAALSARALASGAGAHGSTGSSSSPRRSSTTAPSRDPGTASADKGRARC